MDKKITIVVTNKIYGLLERIADGKNITINDVVNKAIWFTFLANDNERDAIINKVDIKDKNGAVES